MTLRQFLDAAYAILIGEYQRMGMDLSTALENVQQWAARSGDEPAPAAVASRNERSLAELESMMKGLA